MFLKGGNEQKSPKPAALGNFIAGVCWLFLCLMSGVLIVRKAGKSLHGGIVINWRLLFEQSKANGGLYREDNLPLEGCGGGWPKRTWFQKRLRHVREQQGEGFADEAKTDNLQRISGRDKDTMLGTQRGKSPAREDRWLRSVNKGYS